MQTVALWFFRNRETGAVTIAQPPNLTLWIVILANLALWLFHPGDRLGAILTIITRGSLLLWALDEVLRGVNPWRRCLGLAVLCYGLTLLRH